MKASWQPIDRMTTEPSLLQECNGLFGTPKYLYSVQAELHSGDICSNALYLPEPGNGVIWHHLTSWSRTVEETREPDYRVLVLTFVVEQGQTLETCRNAIELAESLLHAHLGAHKCPRPRCRLLTMHQDG